MRRLSTLLASVALAVGCVATAATPSMAASPQPLVATASYGTVHVLSREVTGLGVQVNRADNGAPVPGLLFTFYTANDERFVLCTAYTNSAGTASCTSDLPPALPLVVLTVYGYDAVFAGNGQYAPISAHGSVGYA